MELILHNMPNLYCSYYLKGLLEHPLIESIQFKYDYHWYHGEPLLVFDLKKNSGEVRRVAIDNDDPSRPRADLLEVCDYYFATNYLPGIYDQYAKVEPLNPHFPIRLPGPYLRFLASLKALHLSTRQVRSMLRILTIIILLSSS